MDVDTRLRQASSQLRDSLAGEPIPPRHSPASRGRLVLAAALAVTVVVLGGIALVNRPGDDPFGTHPSTTDAQTLETRPGPIPFVWTDPPTTTSTTTATTSTTVPDVADPATGPLFGEPTNVVLLFDDGLNGVVAVDPDNRIGSRTVLIGHGGGDPPYRIARTGDSIIVGWGNVYATDIGSGVSTELGTATIFIPAAEPGRVWLVRWAGAMGQGSATAWQVDVSGQAITEPTKVDFELPVFPIVGVPGGIAVETPGGIRLWYPDGRESVDLGSGNVLAAHGDLLAYCPNTPCVDVLITNLGTGETQTVFSDLRFATDVFGGPSARFSPDGSYLALAATNDVMLVDTAIGTLTSIADDFGDDDYVYINWSPDGHQLFISIYSYDAERLSLGHYNLETGGLALARLPFRGTFDFVVLDRTEATRFLDIEDRSAFDF